MTPVPSSAPASSPGRTDLHPPQSGAGIMLAPDLPFQEKTHVKSFDHPLRDLAAQIMDSAGCPHPALRSRAAIAMLGAVPVTRPHIAPNYGSDLGLRKSDGPAVFLQHGVAEMHMDAQIHAGDPAASRFLAAWRSGELSDAAAAGVLDLLMSFAGCWDEAGSIARGIAEGPRRPASSRLLTYMGSALTGTGDPRAGEHFLLAADTEDAQPAAIGMARVRYAAWLAKRREAPQEAASTLQDLRRWLVSAARDRVVTEADASVMSGVSLNLEALTAVKQKDPRRAEALLSRAVEHLGGTPLVMVGEDERRRYTAQVHVNRGQLASQQGRLEKAAAIVSDNLEWTRAQHPGSVTESLALTGYLEYRLGHNAEAVRLLRDAVAAIAAEGAPSRLLMARKNLAAALSRSGDSRRAEEVLADIRSDPAGLVEYRRKPDHAA
jgi:tetratricopeptide (TPR) repeat protein